MKFNIMLPGKIEKNIGNFDWMPRSRKLCVALLASTLLFSVACLVGPKYQRPPAPTPEVYKEKPPDYFSQAAEWKPATPNDGAPRGKWWEIFGDPQLNQLEEQVSISNQNILAAEAQYRAAREVVRVARSGLFPTVSTSPSATFSHSSANLSSASAGSGTRTGGSTSSVNQNYNFPVDLTYLVDIWGSIRHSVRQSTETAQASYAQLENARLSFQAELAVAYFQLHGVDGVHDLLERTVKSYEDNLQLTKDRFNSGVASGVDVAQAEAQLNNTRAELIDLGIARAQFEHAIAILTGKPPAGLSVPVNPIKAVPPAIPVGIPSTLLERRPDIAVLERQMAAANEQIGIATAAFYPALTLGAAGGFEAGSIAKWFAWPSRFWSVGPQLAETLFDAGKRRAQVAEAQAIYDATVANYRQTVLVSFQQVEDALAALRVLDDETNAQNAAVQAAEQSLDISNYQYKAGTVSYLQVITAQTTALQAEINAINLLTRRMVSSVLLIEALGGGWDASSIPTPAAVLPGK
ncbi:MAG: efflux transporter outer membrane subunit [Acidobacteriia bacterium]|nr:efflux transporter outer membrane subunit [Terriglobia bacterium]